MEWIDLYLIHWPLSCTPDKYDFPIKEDDFLPMDFEGVWAAMEECLKLGLAKCIGVSNFTCKKLKHLLSVAKIPPAVNQVSLPLSSTYLDLMTTPPSHCQSLFLTFETFYMC